MRYNHDDKYFEKRENRLEYFMEKRDFYHYFSMEKRILAQEYLTQET